MQAISPLRPENLTAITSAAQRPNLEMEKLYFLKPVVQGLKQSKYLDSFISAARKKRVLVVQNTDMSHTCWVTDKTLQFELFQLESWSTFQI